MILGIHHVAVGVPDFELGLKFYQEALGFEVVQRTDFQGDNPLADETIGVGKVSAHMAMLKTSNAYIELWQYTNPSPQDHRSQPNDYGYPHFALQVDDIDAEYRRLMEHGMTFHREPVNFGDISAIYGRDPFGNVIELYEIRDTETAQLRRD